MIFFLNKCLKYRIRISKRSIRAILPGGTFKREHWSGNIQARTFKQEHSGVNIQAGTFKQEHLSGNIWAGTFERNIRAELSGWTFGRNIRYDYES